MTEKALTVSFLSGLKYEHFVAGLTAGLVPTLITHPLDLIKLRFAGMLCRLSLVTCKLPVPSDKCTTARPRQGDLNTEGSFMP